MYAIFVTATGVLERNTILPYVHSCIRENLEPKVAYITVADAILWQSQKVKSASVLWENGRIY